MENKINQMNQPKLNERKKSSIGQRWFTYRQSPDKSEVG